jgi:hypothetical protein
MSSKEKRVMDASLGWHDGYGAVCGLSANGRIYSQEAELICLVIMLRRFRDAILWAQALDRCGRQEFLQAAAKLEEIKGARSRASEYLALLGTSYIALEMPDKAKVLLSAALTQSSPTRSDYRAYVQAYCEYYLSVIAGNRGRAVKQLEAALRVEAPPIIRQWLPLS